MTASDRVIRAQKTRNSATCCITRDVGASQRHFRCKDIKGARSVIHSQPFRRSTMQSLLLRSLRPARLGLYRLYAVISTSLASFFSSSRLPGDPERNRESSLQTKIDIESFRIRKGEGRRKISLASSNLV